MRYNESLHWKTVAFKWHVSSPMLYHETTLALYGIQDNLYCTIPVHQSMIMNFGIEIVISVCEGIQSANVEQRLQLDHNT